MNALSNILKFNSKVHRPCLFLSFAMASGILLGCYGHCSWLPWGLSAGTFLLLSCLIKSKSTLMLHLSVIFLGAFYYQSFYILPGNHIAFLSYWDQKNVSQIEGIIDSDIQLKETPYGFKSVFELKLTRVNLNGDWLDASGGILINMFKEVKLQYGDCVRLQGVLFRSKSDPHEKFSYQKYLEKQGLFFICSVGKLKEVQILKSGQGCWWIKGSIKLKQAFKEVLEKYLESQELGLIQAMTLGDKSSMDKDLYALFSKTGTAHILAISGMNMAIIGAIVLFILKAIRVPRKVQFIFTAILLFVYAFVCGWSASVVRSVLMAAVILSSFCVEFESDGLNSLGLAALILLLFNPNNLFDIGFQLSFICVLIIMWTYPLFQSITENYFKNKILTYLVQALLISVIASIGITPLIAYHFNIVSVVGIIANIPIVFLSDVIIALSLGLVVIGAICPLLAIAFAAALKIVFNLTLILTFWFAQIPGAYFYVQDFSFWYLLIYYLALIGVVSIWFKITQRQ